MPEKIIKKRASQRIRKSVNKRNYQQKTGCKRMQSTKSSDAIIADSLSTIRLQPKGGALIFLKDEKDSSAEEIYSGLKKGYKHFAKLMGLGAYPFKAIEKLSMAVQLDWMIKKFRENIPFGFDFEIVQRNYGWSFVIFKELDNNDSYNVIFVEQALKKLKATNPILHDLFVEFIKILVNKIGIDSWWDSYADNFMEEEIENFEFDSEADSNYLQSLKENLQLYRIGLPAFYKKKIHRSGFVGPLLLAKRLSKLRKHCELVAVLIKGCEFLSQPYALWDFGYTANDSMEFSGVRWENQSAIMWSNNDAFFNLHEDYLNTEAGEGIFLPTICKVVDKELTVFDFDWLRNGEEWPTNYSNLINDINNVLDKL